MGHRRLYTSEERSLIEELAFEGQNPAYIVRALQAIGCSRHEDTIRTSAIYRDGVAKLRAGVGRKAPSDVVLLGDLIIRKKCWLVPGTESNGTPNGHIPITLSGGMVQASA